MKNDFVAIADHRFSLRANWGAVECQVLEVDPITTLSYTWAAYGLDSVVTWPLTPTGGVAPTCAWNRPASSQARNRPAMAPRRAGRMSSPRSSRWWRKATDAVAERQP